MKEVKGITAKQMRWAASHDWYLGAELLTGGSYLVEVRCDMYEGRTLTFGSFEDLVVWAGY